MLISKKTIRLLCNGRIILMFFMAVLLSGCDILDEDSIEDNQAKVELKDNPIVVTSQSSNSTIG